MQIPARPFHLEDVMTKAEFLRHLKAHRDKMPRQTLKTLRGQALSGDVAGALRGMARVLKKDSDIMALFS